MRIPEPTPFTRQPELEASLRRADALRRPYYRYRAAKEEIARLDAKRAAAAAELAQAEREIAALMAGAHEHSGT